MPRKRKANGKLLKGTKQANMSNHPPNTNMEFKNNEDDQDDSPIEPKKRKASEKDSRTSGKEQHTDEKDLTSDGEGRTSDREDLGKVQKESDAFEKGQQTSFENEPKSDETGQNPSANESKTGKNGQNNIGDEQHTDGKRPKKDPRKNKRSSRTGNPSTIQDSMEVKKTMLKIGNKSKTSNQPRYEKETTTGAKKQKTDGTSCSDKTSPERTEEPMEAEDDEATVDQIMTGKRKSVAKNTKGAKETVKLDSTNDSFQQTEEEGEDVEDEIDQHTHSPSSSNINSFNSSSSSSVYNRTTDDSFNTSTISPVIKRRKPFTLHDTTINNSSPNIRQEANTNTHPQSITDTGTKKTDGIPEYYVYYMAVFLMVLVLASWFVYSTSIPVSLSASHHNQFEEFVKKIDTVKMSFPSQEQRLWRTIKASGRHVLNVTSPDYPAVLLFVTNKKPNNDDKFDASSCLARKISAEFDSANMVTSSSSPIVDCGTLDTRSSNQQKLDFDNNLRNYLGGSYKSVVVENLEMLSPTAALMLHGYCDGDNAPYKDVMIILVLHVEASDLNPRSAEAWLKDYWETELKTDKVEALLSRVANNIVIINPESNTLSGHCS